MATMWWMPGICKCVDLLHWCRYVKCLHFQRMPQVPVATDSPIQHPGVSALAVALVRCANSSASVADRSHCLTAAPANGAAARFLLAPVVGLGNAVVSFLAMASVNRAPLPSCRSWITDHGSRIMGHSGLVQADWTAELVLPLQSRIATTSRGHRQS